MSVAERPAAPIADKRHVAFAWAVWALIAVTAVALRWCA